MTDPSLWSADRDPPRDDALARLLHAAEPTAPGTGVDWDRLHAAVMRRAAESAVPAGLPREWWDVVMQWRRMAAAASVAAMLAAGALIWRAESGVSGLMPVNAAPESVALARVVAAYPNDAVLTSLLSIPLDDELTSWGTR
jgi:hypothetical protein